MEWDDDLDAGQRARLSLAGLSVGDALGERFFGPEGRVLQAIEAREVPQGPWRFTDDTVMALSIVQTLEERQALDADVLARHLARRYIDDPGRGYGAAAHDLLLQINLGASWEAAAGALFGGQGSFGNGAAMRVAPLGAYLAGDLERVRQQAILSARVTHMHPEGEAGAVAVAVAAAWAWEQGAFGDPQELFEVVLAHTPPSQTRDGVEQAAALPSDTQPRVAARTLGSGQRISAQDTVPFVIWCAARHLDSFEEGFWTTVAGLGDRDTTCAMVGGIVALSSRHVPDAWLASRESLPDGFST
jgi:ADP-ribosylglycohydrolase